MAIAPQLVPLALARVGDLADDDAKEAALRALVRAINEITEPGEEIAEAIGRVLTMSRALGQRSPRVRTFVDVCEALTISLLPLARRRELLDQALSLARASADVPERVECAVAAILALVALRSGEPHAELCDALLGPAREIADEDERTRAVLQIVSALATAGEVDRAREVALTLPPSGRRAHALAHVAFALEREGLAAEATAEIERAVGELRELSPSYDGALALRLLLARAVKSGADPDSGALPATLAVVDGMGEARFQKDALAGAIQALPVTTLEGEALHAALGRLSASIARVDDPEARAELLGALAQSLAALGELSACLAKVHEVIALAGSIEDLPAVLPIPDLLGKLADTSVSYQDLELFAGHALDLLMTVEDELGVAALLREMTSFFMSPALWYATRVALLERALVVAQRLLSDKVRIEIVAHIADGLSIAGATERGDALFAGLVSGIGPILARSVRLSRATALVRLGRTADARAEIAVAAVWSDESWPAVEELAMTMARCGFLADMLAEVERIPDGQRPITLAQLADGLVEARYLDPYLREIGLSSLLERAEGPVRETIACLLDQLRVLEGLGDVAEILDKAYARTTALENREAAAIFAQQLVGALIQRIGVDAAVGKD